MPPMPATPTPLVVGPDCGRPATPPTPTPTPPGMAASGPPAVPRRTLPNGASTPPVRGSRANGSDEEPEPEVLGRVRLWPPSDGEPPPPIGQLLNVATGARSRPAAMMPVTRPAER